MRRRGIGSPDHAAAPRAPHPWGSLLPQASQHARCKLRVRIAKRPGGSGGGEKFQLSALMVSHFPLVLDGRIAGEAGGLADRP